LNLIKRISFGLRPSKAEDVKCHGLQSSFDWRKLKPVYNNLLFVLVVVLSAACSPEKRFSPAQTRPFISWQTMTSFAREALRNARGHEVNDLILEFEPNPEQPGHAWNTFFDDLALDDHAPKVAKQGKARQDVEKLRSNIDGIIKEAKFQGIDVYLMGTEFSFPPGMLSAYPEAANANSEFLWHFLETRLEEVLRALPEAAGVVLYTDEPSDLILYELKGVDHRTALKRLLNLYLDVCRRNNRRFIVTTFVNYSAEKMDILLSVLKQIPPSDHFLIDNYVCPGDWGLIKLFNPAIGKVGGHPEFLTFDYTGEVWGQANIPLCQARLLRDRLQQAQQKGAKLAGINGYVSWYSQSLFGTPSAINLDLGPQLLRNPNQDPESLVHSWLEQRYSEKAAELLTPAFLNSFEVADKAIQTLGFWVSEAPKSAFPDPVWIDFSIRTESLAVFDPAYKSIEEKLVHPDMEILAKVIEEKNSAVDKSAAALQAVDKAKPYLEEPDYQQLRKQFSLAFSIARAYRLYLEMHLRFRMWDHAGRGAVPPELKVLRKSMQKLATEMEKKVGSPTVFCPKSLMSCLARLDSYLNGEKFPIYPTALVRAHDIQYPPVDWGICVHP
jgi:hypothetical protein